MVAWPYHELSGLGRQALRLHSDPGELNGHGVCLRGTRGVGLPERLWRGGAGEVLVKALQRPQHIEERLWAGKQSLPNTLKGLVTGQRPAGEKGMSQGILVTFCGEER